MDGGYSEGSPIYSLCQWFAYYHGSLHLCWDNYLIELGRVFSQNQYAIIRKSISRDEILLLDEPRCEQVLMHEYMGHLL